MLVRSRPTSTVIDSRAENLAQTGSGYGSDHAMVHARMRLRTKATRLSNCPAILDAVNFKTTALEYLRLKLRNRCELNEDASPKDE